MNEFLWKRFDYKGSGADLLKCFHTESHVFLLESSLNDCERGRYSLMGFDPFEIFESREPDAFRRLKETYRPYKQESQAPLTPLPAGIVGYISYDYGLRQERIHLCCDDDLNLPHCYFGFYDCILTVDHYLQKLTITSTGLPEKTKGLQRSKAQWRIDKIEKRFRQYFDSREQEDQGQDFCVYRDASDLDIKSNFSKEQYCEAVKKALSYISCGDIYQVNLSQRFELDSRFLPNNPAGIYQALRALSPSHFGGYMDCGSHQIISSSPERFLNLQGRLVQTRPMKGTRRRGAFAEEDHQLKDEIIESAKDKAELLMITDLERNDLGKVCEYGSVSVKELRTIEEYKTVFQATSTVEGILRKDRDCFDLLQACFPGGSITGCPKIRAMEIIEELEPHRRGIYTGSLGYMTFSGNMDFNILIRTLLAHQDKIYFQAGGGIVADSNPENEYQETLIKAKAMRQCLLEYFSKTDSLQKI